MASSIFRGFGVGLADANTWTGVQTFSQRPIFSNGITIGNEVIEDRGIAELGTSSMSFGSATGARTLVYSGGVLFRGTAGALWARILVPSLNLIQLTSSAGTAGISFDVTTDGTLRLRNFANSADGIFRAASFNANGSAGVSAGPFTSITGITVVGGIVTALTGS